MFYISQEKNQKKTRLISKSGQVEEESFSKWSERWCLLLHRTFDFGAKGSRKRSPFSQPKETKEETFFLLFCAILSPPTLVFTQEASIYRDGAGWHDPIKQPFGRKKSTFLLLLPFPPLKVTQVLSPPDYWAGLMARDDWYKTFLPSFNLKVPSTVSLN